MNLDALARRAVEIAGLYEDSDRAAYGRPWTRREMMLGFVVGAAELAKCVQAVEGVRRVPEVEARIAHVLADCTWSVLALADLYGVEMDRAFRRTMDELEAHLRQTKPDAPPSPHAGDPAERAAEIGRLYEDYELATYGRAWTRVDVVLGFVGDLGDLAKLIQAAEGVRRIPHAEERLEHELADCLWSLLVIAGLYGVDLEQAFLHTMDELENSLRST